MARLDARLLDRAAGTLLGTAAGDALGVPYEHGSRPLDDPPQMLGGGLAGLEPGRWSDDTELTLVLAQVTATGILDVEEVAQGFVAWFAAGPAGVGVQTRRVLDAVPLGRAVAPLLRRRSAELHAQTGRTAGNGSLMRTSPVALAHLGNIDAIASSARAISELTHHDPDAGDACVLWCLAIDHAVRTGRLDVRVGLPYVDDRWAARLDEAESVTPSHYADGNGWAVAALQAAWSAAVRAPSLEAGIKAAVSGGGDTDTVGAIAGALLGARYGASAVPVRWRRALHGWPGLRARDLIRLGVLAASGGHSDCEGWPAAPTVRSYAGSETTVIPHPDDPGVLLGGVGALRPSVADAVVSLCRLGTSQAPLPGVAPEDHVEVWLVDAEDANNDLPTVLADAATAVRDLRAEGKTVFLHCVHAHTRTPVVAAVYGALVTGTPAREALARVLAVLSSAWPRLSIAAALDGGHI